MKDNRRYLLVRRVPYYGGRGLRGYDEWERCDAKRERGDALREHCDALRERGDALRERCNALRERGTTKMLHESDKTTCIEDQPSMLSKYRLAATTDSITKQLYCHLIKR